MADVNVETLKVSSYEIKNIFNEIDAEHLQFEDVVAFVRQRYPNPWQKVILDIDTIPGSPAELERHNIFVKGVNHERVNEITSVSSEQVFFAVNVADLDENLDGCGIDNIIAEYAAEYDITDGMRIFLVGMQANASDVAKLRKVKEWATQKEVYNIIFPIFISKEAALLANGFDISKYAKELETASIRSQLTYDMLQKVLDEIASKINPETTIIQDLRGKRTVYVQLLTTYLCLKYNLPPMHPESFISDYVKYNFNYPYGKLSLFERIVFLRNLKKRVGYLTDVPHLSCTAVVGQKIYPGIHFVFDLETQEVVRDQNIVDMLDYAMQSERLKIMDFRRYFSQSQAYFTQRPKETSTDLVVMSDGEDSEKDFQIVNLFMKFSDMITEEDDENGEIFMSVKNTVLAEFDGKQYLLYCPEGMAITAALMSDWFVSENLTIKEDKFDHLIDDQLQVAVDDFENSDYGKADKSSQALAVSWRSRGKGTEIIPAIPYEVTLAMYLLPGHTNGLSYYDYNLRCKTNVLPIVTAMDTDLGSIDPLTSMLSLKRLRADPSSAHSINCFGTIGGTIGDGAKLYVTYKAFRGKELLS